MTSCKESFEDGSLLLIRGKITTLPAVRGTAGLGRGLSKVTRSRDGKYPDPVPFYGFMGNVSRRLALLSRRLIAFQFIAGAGKSVLWYINLSMYSPPKLTFLASSTIIEDIDAMRNLGFAALAMYYYDFREDEKKDLRGLLSSVLVQLCQQSDSYCSILSKFYSEHENGSRYPSDDTLSRCLKDILELPGQVPIFLIVDALDECPNWSALSSPREKVLLLLAHLIDSQLPNLRICVTSRPETDIKSVLEPLTFRSVCLHNESGQMEDIEKYIKSVVNTNRNMRRWKPEHKQLVIDVLTKRADGM